MDNNLGEIPNPKLPAVKADRKPWWDPLQKDPTYTTKAYKLLSIMNPEIIEELDLEDVDEAGAKRKRVVRGGKVVRKLFCPLGMKAQDGRCVRISSKEKRSRRKGARKAARTLKRKPKTARLRKLRKSLMRRRRAKLK